MFLVILAHGCDILPRHLYLRQSKGDKVGDKWEISGKTHCKTVARTGAATPFRCEARLEPRIHVAVMSHPGLCWMRAVHACIDIRFHIHGFFTDQGWGCFFCLLFVAGSGFGFLAVLLVHIKGQRAIPQHLLHLFTFHLLGEAVRHHRFLFNPNGMCGGFLWYLISIGGISIFFSTSSPQDLTHVAQVNCKPLVTSRSSTSLMQVSFQASAICELVDVGEIHRWDFPFVPLVVMS